MDEYKLMIGGKWVNGEEVREIKSPYDGSGVAKIHFAGKKQVEEAVGAAHEAFEVTKKLASYERAEALEFISSEIYKRGEELAVSIAKSAGKAIKSARVEASRGVNTFKIVDIVYHDLFKTGRVQTSHRSRRPVSDPYDIRPVSFMRTHLGMQSFGPAPLFTQPFVPEPFLPPELGLTFFTPMF